MLPIFLSTQRVHVAWRVQYMPSQYACILAVWQYDTAVNVQIKSYKKTLPQGKAALRAASSYETG